MEYELSCKYHEYETLQLVVAQAFGGKIEDSPGSSIVTGQQIESMEDLISVFHTIGGKVG